jgi:hypothetical protein
MRGGLSKADPPTFRLVAPPRHPAGVLLTPRRPSLGAALFAPCPRLPVVPGYEILGELGRGGRGVVYHARHVSLGRPVALKMILPDRAGGDDLERFRREVHAIAALQRPHIIQIYEIGAEGGLAYRPDSRALAVGASGAQVVLWAVPPEAAGEPGRLRAWVEALTAQTMDEQRRLQRLEGPAWEECRRRLEERGGPPTRDWPAAIFQPAEAGAGH